MQLRHLVNHLTGIEKEVAEKFIRLIYSSNANTAYQFIFTEAILRVIEQNIEVNELDLDTIFIYYANLAYDWCAKKGLLLGGTTEGRKGASKLNSVIEVFVKKHNIEPNQELTNGELLELKKKIRPLSKWVQENVGSDSKGICTITDQYLIITSETRAFVCKYINDLRESNELMAKKFLYKIEDNRENDWLNLNLFQWDQSKEIKMMTSKQNIEIVRERVKQQMEYIQRYMNMKGLKYPVDILSNFYLSLKTKPFTILAGISGTGKSKLVRLFAEAIGAEFELIPVRPDWSDATDLLGYRDLNQNFHKGRFIKIIERAQADLSKPYVVCLDEMNLARVEYYFSDFLSLIESRRRNGSEIVTDCFVGTDLANFYIPENLYIVGTVNMDETTFQFSKKVLDRANTIELSEIDLDYDFEKMGEEEVQPLAVYNEVLKSKYLVLQECAAHKKEVKEIISQLIMINEFLKPCGLQFAYRVRDEIIFYMLYNREFELLDVAEAFDYQLLQKILPRMSGTSSRIREVLVKLACYCIQVNYSASEFYEVEELEEHISEAVYPKSFKKIIDMLRRYDEDGFTSFWF